LNYDEENTFAESNLPASQSENSTAIGHLVDQTYADAIVLSFSNRNHNDSVSSSYTEISNSDTSPERNYASNKRKLAKESIKVFDIIPESDFEDEEDTCSTTFTQCINTKLEANSQTTISGETSIGPKSPKNAFITITTKYKPPDPKRILESITMYGIPKCRAQKPFFSNKCDLAKQKESTSTKSAYFDIPAFKSSLDITSLSLWRRMKVNEFHPSGATIKTCHIKRTLAGYNLLTIKPLIAPPSPKDIMNWIKAKKYLLEKNRNIKLFEHDKKKAINVQDTQHPLINTVNEKNELQSGISNNSVNSTVEKSVSLTSQHSNSTSDTTKFEFTRHSDKSQTSEDSLNPSLQKVLKNSLLYKQNKVHQQLGVSYGQIECLSKGSYGNASSENLQNARAVSAVSLLFQF